jgi:hypothetical protein
MGQGRLKRPRIDQFFQNYLIVVKGDEAPAAHLFAEFRDYAEKNHTLSPADHLRSLHTYGSIFERFHIGYDTTSKEGKFFYRNLAEKRHARSSRKPVRLISFPIIDWINPISKAIATKDAIIGGFSTYRSHFFYA